MEVNEFWSWLGDFMDGRRFFIRCDYSGIESLATRSNHSLTPWIDNTSKTTLTEFRDHFDKEITAIKKRLDDHENQCQHVQRTCEPDAGSQILKKLDKQEVSIHGANGADGQGRNSSGGKYCTDWEKVVANILTIILVTIAVLVVVHKMNEIESTIREHDTRISHISKKNGKLYVDMFRVKEAMGMNTYTGEQLAVRRIVPPHPALYKWRPFGYRAAP